jgi:hypothetical protein
MVLQLTLIIMLIMIFTANLMTSILLSDTTPHHMKGGLNMKVRIIAGTAS